MPRVIGVCMVGNHGYPIVDETEEMPRFMDQGRLFNESRDGQGGAGIEDGILEDGDHARPAKGDAEHLLFTVPLSSK